MILYDFFKIHTAAENIECAAYGKVKLSLSERFQLVKVIKRAYAACVGQGDLPPLPQHLCELFFNAVRFALDIDCVDKELIAVGREPVEDFAAELQIGELLPPVRYDIVVLSSFSAGQVKYDALLSDRFNKLVKVIEIDCAVLENIRSHYNMRSAVFKIFGGIIGIDSSAYLKSALILMQR